MFVGYASEDPERKGEQLLSSIRDDVSSMEFVDPDIVSNYEVYKKVRKFLNDRLVETPETPQSGVSIARRVICAIWNGKDMREQRTKALAVFDTVKRGEWNPAMMQSPSQVAQASESPFNLAQPPKGRQSNPSNPVDSPHNASSGQHDATTTLSKAYQYEKQKFTGDTEQDWTTKLARYNLICLDNNVRGVE